MLRTERLADCICRANHFLLIDRRIKRFAAFPAPNQIQREHIIPQPDQKMLKLDGVLRTDPPALSAAGALGHIVTERSPIVPIGITQGRGRTIFHTGQAPVALIVDAKVRHSDTLMVFRKSFKNIGVCAG
jgi:hypothetical protein